jgi:hypothetical protein
MKRLVLSFLLVISGLLLTGPTPLASQQPSLFQELGGFAILAKSNHVELPSPKGWGAGSSWEFGGSLMARLSYHTVSDETRKKGVVCDQYSQRINCRWEVTQTSVDLSGLRGILMWALPLGDQVRLGAGGGLSFNHVTTETVGIESGLEADLLAPNAGIIGFTTLISAAVTPLSSFPLSLVGSFGVHWVNFKTCSANDPPQYDPYCGRESFREIELGLSYSF